TDSRQDDPSAPSRERRHSLIEEIMDTVPDATPEERAAFTAYCEENGIGRRRLRRSLFQSFIQSHRDQSLREWRRQQANRFVADYANLIREKDLSVTSNGFFFKTERALDEQGLRVLLRAEATRPFESVDIDDETLGTP